MGVLLGAQASVQAHCVQGCAPPLPHAIRDLPAPELRGGLSHGTLQLVTCYLSPELAWGPRGRVCYSTV